MRSPSMCAEFVQETTFLLYTNQKVHMYISPNLFSLVFLTFCTDPESYPARFFDCEDYCCVWCKWKPSGVLDASHKTWPCSQDPRKVFPRSTCSWNMYSRVMHFYVIRIMDMGTSWVLHVPHALPCAHWMGFPWWHVPVPVVGPLLYVFVNTMRAYALNFSRRISFTQLIP